MERDLVPVEHESNSNLQDCMGDAHSKDFENLKSSQRELLQVDSKQSSPNSLECPSTLLLRAPFIEPTEDYPVYSSYDSIVDIAVEALEDDEILKENETISCVKHIKDLLIPEGHNTSHPKTIQQIDSEEKRSIEVVQKVLSIETESTEILPAFSKETESTKEMKVALSGETESTEEIQPAFSGETESTEEIQPALSGETESTEEIQPALSEATESMEEIQSSLPVETEYVEIQQSLPQEFESTEVVQPALSGDIESKKIIQSDFPEVTKSIKVINTALSKETSAETEIIQTVSEGITSTVVIQPVVFEKTESTKSVQPAHSETKLSEVKQPVLFEEFHLNEVIESPSMTASCKEKVNFSPESKESQIFSNDINSPLDSEVLSKVISKLELHFSNREENLNSSFPPALETESFLSLLNMEQYKNASLFQYVNDQAVSGGSVIVTPTYPLPEPIFSNLVIPPLSPPTDSLPMKSNETQNRSSESIKPVASEETKLARVKKPVLSEEINLNEVIELNSLEAKSIEKAISSFQSKTSSTHSSDIDSSAEPGFLSNRMSKTDSDSSNSEEHSNSFPPMIDTEGFFSLLNTDEYKNGSYSGVKWIRQVNQSGSHMISRPFSPFPEPKFPIFEMPPLSPTTESRLKKMIENFNSITLSTQSNSEATLKFQNSEEKSNPSVPPILDNERFDSALNIKESNYGKSSVIPGKGRMTVNTSTPCQPSSFIFEMLPSPTEKNYTQKSAGNLKPCKDAIVPTDIPRTTCDPSSLNLEMLPSLPTKKPQVKSIGSLIPTKDAIVLTGIPRTTCKPSSLNFETIPSPPARNRPKKSVGNLNPAKDVTLPTGIQSPTCRLIFPNLEVPPLSSPAKNHIMKSVSNLIPTNDPVVPTDIPRTTCEPSSLNFELLPSPPAKNHTKKSVENLCKNKDATVPTDIPRTTCEPSSLNFQVIPSTSAKEHPMKSLGNLGSSKDAMVPTDIPSTAYKPIFPNLEVPPLCPPAKNPTKKSVGNSRPTKETIVPTDIPRTTCEPSSLNFEMLPSPPARNRRKKSAGNLRPNKDVIVPTDVPSATCKPIFPNLEVPPLSPIAKNLPKNIKHLSPTKAGTVPNNRYLTSLLSKLADWIYRGMEKSSNSFEKPLDIDFINNFKMELEKGVDILDEMAKFMDTLVTAVEGLPDPNSILPYELGSEKFPIRDRLVSAGLIVQRKLEKMKKEVISDGDAFFCLCSDEGKLSNTELALKTRDIIFRLFVKISEHFLKLGMEIEKFRDNNRDFCEKMDISQNGICF